MSIHGHVYFRVKPPFVRPTACVPPLAPVPCAWVLTWVASINNHSKSGAVTKVSSRRSHRHLSRQRQKRRWRDKLNPARFEVEGKANGTRAAPWGLCGPLREWLAAHPPAPGLRREATGMAVEKAFGRVRKRHGLTPDVLRHTALSAMCNALAASFAQVTLAAGNSESMLRRHYLGVGRRS
jgi:hypothetical protein